MTYCVFAYRDKKIGFMRPYVMENKAVAQREFSDSIRRSDFRYPTDFELWELGTFDRVTGSILPIKEGPQFVLDGASLLNGGEPNG